MSHYALSARFATRRMFDHEHARIHVCRDSNVMPISNVSRRCWNLRVLAFRYGMSITNELDDVRRFEPTKLVLRCSPLYIHRCILVLLMMNGVT